MQLSTRNREIPVRSHVLVSFLIGLLASAKIIALGYDALAPITLFDVTALVYGVWTWWDIWPMDAKSTASHALREYASQLWAQFFLIAREALPAGIVSTINFQDWNVVFVPGVSHEQVGIPVEAAEAVGANEE